MPVSRKSIGLTVLGTLLGGVVLLGITSCADLRYLANSSRGHLQVMTQRQPIDTLLRDPGISPELRKKLTKVLSIRDFASSELLLPDNGSYRSYADLKRPFVVWNVVATPEFSLTPLQWCFPVAGCVTYRGFHRPEQAEEFAARLRAAGYDVHWYGVSAYSTLGWFDDPVLNTFINRSEAELAGLIFHELAHQQVYVKNDTPFNEAFAMTVEREGVLRWLRRFGSEENIADYLLDKRREEDFLRLGRQTQQQLADLYAQPLADEEKRRRKTEIFQQLREHHAQWRQEQGGFYGYDRWFAAELNNAKFASVNTYHTFIPAFEVLLGEGGGDLASFYREVSRLGLMPTEQRLARLEELRTILLTSDFSEEELPTPPTAPPAAHL
jgi:predicted aminopeptidase